MIPARLASTHSPLSEDEYSTASPLSTPTPTQPFTGDFMRREISETEYDERAPLRDSKIFDALMAALQKARTVVNFEWKPAKRQGKFEPAPYPIDPISGSLVDPLDLPQYLQENVWARPVCLCSIRGIDRETVLTPEVSGSPPQWAMHLVCPEGECPYSVNLTELVRKYEAEILANHHWELAVNSLDGDDYELSRVTAKRRRLNSNAQRIPSWIIIASGVGPQEPSSSSKMRSKTSSTEAISIISELLGADGIPRAKFEALFLLCEACDRVMPRVGQAKHECLLQALSSDSEFESDVDSVLNK